VFNRKRDKDQSFPIKHDEGKAVTIEGKAVIIQFPRYRLPGAAW
jgi:hypothetical protein